MYLSSCTIRTGKRLEDRKNDKRARITSVTYAAGAFAGANLNYAYRIRDRPYEHVGEVL